MVSGTAAASLRDRVHGRERRPGARRRYSSAPERSHRGALAAADGPRRVQVVDRVHRTARAASSRRRSASAATKRRRGSPTTSPTPSSTESHDEPGTSSRQVERVLSERRLVEHEHARPRRQHGGDREPPLLAAGERERVRLGEAVEARARRAARRLATHDPRRRGLSARGPNSSSSRTVAATNWCSGSWNTVPMRVSRSRDRQRNGSPRRPRRRARLERAPASAGGAVRRA